MLSFNLFLISKRSLILTSFFVITNLVSCSFVDELYKKTLTEQEFNELIKKANMASSQDDWGRALVAYEQAVAIKPNDLELRMKLAEAYERDQRQGQARLSYQLIIDHPLVTPAQMKQANNRKIALSPKLIPPVTSSTQTRNIKREESFKDYEKSKGSDFEIAPAKDVKDVYTVNPPELKSNLVVDQNKLESEVRVFLDSWRAAWASKDLKRYFSHYVNTYSGDSKTAVLWRSQRKAMLSTNQTIALALNDVYFVNISSDQAEVTFMQKYQAGEFKDSGQKLLKLIKVSDRWQIVQERFKAK
jgi:hypothetical protein